MDVPEIATDEVEVIGARLDRAVEHFEAFRDRWAEHLDTEPHSVGIEVGEGGAGRIVFTRHTNPPAVLSIVLGEYLYELRAALDNTLYAVAMIDSDEDPPPGAGQLEWPICDTKRLWESTRRRRLKHLDPALQDALYRVQPFQAEAPGHNPLLILHDMARIDRHRAVHFVTSSAQEGWLKFDRTLVTDVEVYPGPVAADGTLAIFTWLGTDSITQEHIDGHTEFQPEVIDVQVVPSLDGTELVPPWRTLEQRLRALHKGVAEYVDGLLGLAIDVRERRQNRDPSPPT